VSERYAARKDVLAYLFDEVKAGSVGKWESTPMPPEIVPDA
jgi:cytochrome c551/c552